MGDIHRDTVEICREIYARSTCTMYTGGYVGFAAAVAARCCSLLAAAAARCCSKGVAPAAHCMAHCCCCSLLLLLLAAAAYLGHVSLTVLALI